MLTAAFPHTLRRDALTIADVMPDSRLPPAAPFTVLVDGEPVLIPYRIHHDPPAPEAFQTLTPIQQTMLSCWYTRHHDGFLRQRHLDHVIGVTLPWVTPFVVAPIGEYVLPILTLIRRELTDLDEPDTKQHLLYGRFAAENPAFLNLTAQRVASYWDCYFRNRHSSFIHHPGTTLIASLRAAARTYVTLPATPAAVGEPSGLIVGVQLHLRETSDGGRRTPVSAGRLTYQPNWSRTRPDATRQSGAPVLCTSQRTVAPGDNCRAVIVPLYPPFWNGLQVGDQLYLYEGGRQCGEATVLKTAEITRPLDPDIE